VSILAAVGAAGIARYARSSIADALMQEFVRTARAKGAGAARVYFRHVLATVLPSLVVLFALSLPGLVAGSIFVEAVFAWPGMGRLMVNAIIARDYPLVMGAAAVYAAAVVFANLAGDAALPLVDPRRRACDATFAGASTLPRRAFFSCSRRLPCSCRSSRDRIRSASATSSRFASCRRSRTTRTARFTCSARIGSGVTCSCA
jgi:hypothetical protein